MKSFYSTLALAGVALALPQGVDQNIAPSSPPPAGCTETTSGTFQITTFNVTTAAKRDLDERDILTIDLNKGILTDSVGRTGYIASNFQFQFDEPPQAGALYTAGFSLCGNNSLALGGSAIFYQCYSGGFYNLYDRSWAAQCSPIYIEAINKASGSPAASQGGDGQPKASSAATQLSDGQPQASSAGLGEASDGQIAMSTTAAVSQLTDGQPQATSAAPAPVSQITDGQPQASSAAGAPVSQLTDGQPQATSAAGAPVSQLTDGQPQASSAAGAPVSQISDGQPQVAATTTGVPVSQISDGQIQAKPTNGTLSTGTPVPFLGGASQNTVGAAGAFAIMLAAWVL